MFWAPDRDLRRPALTFVAAATLTSGSFESRAWIGTYLEPRSSESEGRLPSHFVPYKRKPESDSHMRRDRGVKRIGGIYFLEGEMWVYERWKGWGRRGWDLGGEAGG